MMRVSGSVKGVVNPLVTVILISIILVLGWGLLSMTVNYLSAIRFEQQLYTFINRISADTRFYIEALSSNESTYTVYVGLLRASNTPIIYYLCILNQADNRPIGSESIDVDIFYNGSYQDARSIVLESNNIYILSRIARYAPLSAEVDVVNTTLYMVNFTGSEPLSIRININAEQQPKLILLLLVPYNQKYYEVKRLYVEWGRT